MRFFSGPKLGLLNTVKAVFGQACVKGHAEFSAHWQTSPAPPHPLLPESLVHEDPQGASCDVKG